MNLPSVIRNYQLFEKIQSLSYGDLHRAVDLRTGEEVQIAILADFFTNSFGILEAFPHECELASRLSHPNILPILEYGVVEYGVEKCMFVITKPRPKVTLRNILNSLGRLPVEKVVEFAQQIGDAQMYAGASGVWVSSLNPDDIGIDDSGKLILADLWWLQTFQAYEDAVQIGVYLAPEVAPGPAAAQYVLANLVYEMLSGLRNDISTIDQTLQNPEDGIATGKLPPGVNKSVWHILGKALSIRSQDRFESISVFLTAFKAMALSGVPARRPPENYRQGEFTTAWSSEKKRDNLQSNFSQVSLRPNAYPIRSFQSKKQAEGDNLQTKFGFGRLLLFIVLYVGFYFAILGIHSGELKSDYRWFGVLLYLAVSVIAFGGQTLILRNWLRKPVWWFLAGVGVSVAISLISSFLGPQFPEEYNEILLAKAIDFRVRMTAVNVLLVGLAHLPLLRKFTGYGWYLAAQVPVIVCLLLLYYTNKVLENYWWILVFALVMGIIATVVFLRWILNRATNPDSSRWRGQMRLAVGLMTIAFLATGVMLPLSISAPTQADQGGSSHFVSSKGGEFKFGESVRILIPEGAVSKSGTLTTFGLMTALDPRGVHVIGSVFEINLNGAELTAPVKISIKLPKDVDMDHSYYQMYHLPDEKDTGSYGDLENWEPVMTNIEDGYLVAWTDSFSKFQVINWYTKKYIKYEEISEFDPQIRDGKVAFLINGKLCLPPAEADKEIVVKAFLHHVSGIFLMNEIFLNEWNVKTNSDGCLDFSYSENDCEISEYLGNRDRMTLKISMEFHENSGSADTTSDPIVAYGYSKKYVRNVPQKHTVYVKPQRNSKKTKIISHEVVNASPNEGVVVIQEENVVTVPNAIEDNRYQQSSVDSPNEVIVSSSDPVVIIGNNLATVEEVKITLGNLATFGGMGGGDPKLFSDASVELYPMEIGADLASMYKSINMPVPTSGFCYVIKTCGYTVTGTGSRHEGGYFESGGTDVSNDIALWKNLCPSAPNVQGTKQSVLFSAKCK